MPEIKGKWQGDAKMTSLVFGLGYQFYSCKPEKRSKKTFHDMTRFCFRNQDKRDKNIFFE